MPFEIDAIPASIKQVDYTAKKKIHVNVFTQTLPTTSNLLHIICYDHIIISIPNFFFKNDYS